MRKKYTFTLDDKTVADLDAIVEKYKMNRSVAIGFVVERFIQEEKAIDSIPTLATFTKELKKLSADKNLKNSLKK